MAIKNKTSSKIIGIQFSILSPDEIIRNSVAEITSKETYNGIKPKVGGLFDPRMGVIDPGLICPTDGENYINCPGYFGHIILAKPVFWVQYLSTVIKVLKCVCFKCSKLLIEKEEYEYLDNYNHSKRWDKFNKIIGNMKIKRCGECTNNGCGCLQPNKIIKEGYSTIIGKWENDMILKFTPEIIIQIFKKISQEDIEFMGLSYKWARPEWMICQVQPVPPPSVRPSVTHDGQQRSEDDLTHIMINIIKYNNTLKEKIKEGASETVIEPWTSVLQYYISTLIDNKIPGTPSVTQRSGRPLKSISERHKGKIGRVRGNLMGKRVDFSARSVITPDPELSIVELGVPKKIAMNITKPIYVTEENKEYLLFLIKNGPDKYPGAKILEKKNGENISLRYIDRENVNIQLGDCVHRHMLDGDYVLFNRQPTLHRMSMMSHVVKVLNKGDTFRMNVADTKPYNADFDGDEMNMHMPQNDEAEMELKHLAAIPYQIVSPANNNSIIGIFQDSLLGSYLLTRKNIKFTRKEAMNLIEKTINPDISIFNDKTKEYYTSHEIITTILPNISLNYKLNDEEDSPENTIHIQNGIMKSGQINKGVYGKSGKGLLQRIYNDYSCIHCQEFIDNIQSIVTEYMKTTGFSVGMSDLIASDLTKKKIISIIKDKKKEVSKLIDDIHFGVYENKSSLTNRDHFEGEVNNILNNASKETSKNSMENIDKDNRFITIITCGSKGNDLNMSQMISCLGQQNVENKRIPYSFTNRTLPHFKQFDDNPEARGFVESSFIEGLTPEELFFHAMGGRVGLIDTAVKTSTTGYIQRRLIKGLEDIQIMYDRTVRNNKNKIIQYSYGSTNMDTIHIENINLDLFTKSIEDIYKMFYYDYKNKVNKLIFTKETISRYKKEESVLKERISKEIKELIHNRDYFTENVLEYFNDTIIYLPVSFQQSIINIKNNFEINNESLSDITPNEIYALLDSYYEKLTIYKPCKLFKLCYYYYLNPHKLIYTHKYNRDAVVHLLKHISFKYKKSIVNPGEMVGMISAQSIGEPTTQMTLNTFHYAGVASKSNVTRGVPRMEELLSLTRNIKNPSITIYMNEYEEENKESVYNLINKIENIKLNNIIDKCEIYYSPNGEIDDSENNILDFYKDIKTILTDVIKEEEVKYNNWILRIYFDKQSMIDLNIDIQEIHFVLEEMFNNKICCYYNDMNETNVILNIKIPLNSKDKEDETDNIYMIKSFQDKILNNIVIRGIKDIEKVNIREINQYMKMNNEKGIYENKKIYVLDTIGSNLKEILSLDFIDYKRTFSNNIVEMKEVLGIEAARKCLFNEIKEVMEFGGTYINHHHINLLCDRMTCNKKMISIFRHGINNDNIGPIAKASFEETTEMFLRAAKHGELDEMRGVSANVMCGQTGYYGTSSFSVYLNTQEIQNLSYQSIKEEKDKNILNEMYMNKDSCSIDNIKLNNNLSLLKDIQEEKDNDYSLDI